MELEVTYTEPRFVETHHPTSGKPATVETGTQVKMVPLFVEIGDKIKIDTRTGEYMESLGYN